MPVQFELPDETRRLFMEGRRSLPQIGQFGPHEKMLDAVMRCLIALERDMDKVAKWIDETEDEIEDIVNYVEELGKLVDSLTPKWKEGARPVIPPRRPKLGRHRGGPQLGGHRG